MKFSTKFSSLHTYLKSVLSFAILSGPAIHPFVPQVCFKVNFVFGVVLDLQKKTQS